MLIFLIKILVSVICTILYIRILNQFINRKNQNLLVLPITFFYFFFILPIVLDIMIGRSEPLLRYYGFVISYKDFATEFIYNVAILFSMIVYYKSFNKHKQSLDIDLAYKNKDIIFIITILIDAIFLIYFLLQTDISVIRDIFTYNTRYLEKTELLLMISTYSLIIVAFNMFPLLLEKKKDKFFVKLLLLTPFLFFVCLCNGKKSIVFLLVFMLLIIIYTNKIIQKSSRFIIFSIFMLSSLLLYYNFYLVNIVTTRQHESFFDNYNSYRVEFCRDDTLKMVIYDEINNSDKILKYRGESFLFYPTFFIRRKDWPDKPYPYATYFTAKLLNIDRVRYIGWHMTTSIYDEFVSNTGLIALFYLPFLICFLLNKLNLFAKGNSLLELIIKLIGTILISLYFTVQINALLIMNLIFIFLIFLKLITSKFKIKKRI